MSFICKIVEEKIVVRLQIFLILKQKKKGNESKELSPLPKGLALEASHLEFLPKLDNENHRSTLLMQ